MKVRSWKMRVFLSIAISSELSYTKVKLLHCSIKFGSPVALDIEIYTASRGFLASARLLYYIGLLWDTLQ